VNLPLKIVVSQLVRSSVGSLKAEAVMRSAEYFIPQRSKKPGNHEIFIHASRIAKTLRRQHTRSIYQQSARDMAIIIVNKTTKRERPP
jgi:hypothetical protein